MAQGAATPGLDELCSPPAPLTSPTRTRGERDAQLQRAALAFEKDRYAESLLALRAAYAAEPSADILFNMGQACLAAGRQEEAFALYTRAQSESPSQATSAKISSRLDQLRPRLAKSLTLKAILLGSQEKYAEACTVWSRAYELDPRPVYLLQLADALRQAHRSEEALVLYERLTSLPGAGEIATVATRRITELRAPVATTAPTAPAALQPTTPPSVASLSAPHPTEDVPSVPTTRVPLVRKWWFWTAITGAAVAVGLSVGLGTKAALEKPTYPDLRKITF